jgi:hypothetical protein
VICSINNIIIEEHITGLKEKANVDHGKPEKRPSHLARGKKVNKKQGPGV